MLNFVTQNYSTLVFYKKYFFAKKRILPCTLAYTINYKNVNLLRRYIGVTGKILPRRITNLTSKEHRLITKAIRRARSIGLLPFVWLTQLYLLVYLY